MSKRLILLLFCLCSISCAWADDSDYDEVLIWNENQEYDTRNYPFGMYKYSTTQTIYTQSEIGSAGVITDIAYLGGEQDGCLADIKIYFGYTTSDTFENGSSALSSTELTLVYDHNLALGAKAGVWHNLKLDTPFYYNGTENLVVVVSRQSTMTGTYCYREHISANQCLHRQSSNDANYADITNINGYALDTYYKPSVRFIKEHLIVNNATSPYDDTEGITKIYCSESGQLPTLYTQAGSPTKVKISGKATMKDFDNLDNLDYRNKYNITYLDLSDLTIESCSSFWAHYVYPQIYVSGNQGEFNTAVFLETGNEDNYMNLNTLIIPKNISSFVISNCDYDNLKDIYSDNTSPCTISTRYDYQGAILHVPDGSKANWESVAKYPFMVTDSPVKTITTTSEGQLASLLTDDEINTTDILTVNGVIDARDFVTLKSMDELSCLTIKATVSAYDGSDGPDASVTSYAANEIPANGLSNNTTLKKVCLNGQSIANSAFANSSNLISVIFDNSNSNSTIGDYAFDGCTNLTSFTTSVKSVGDFAFRGTKLQTFRPISSTTFGINPFYNTYNTSTLGVSLSMYNGEDEDDTVLDNYNYYDNGGTYDTNYLLSKDDKILYFVNKASYNFSIPSTVTTIEGYAMGYNTSTTTITIPASVESIGKEFLYKYSKLNTITVSNSANFVVIDNALYTADEKELIKYPSANTATSIMLSENVTKIREHAFADANKLKSIIVPVATPPTLEENAFENISKNATIYVPKSSLAAYKAADGWKDLNIVENHFDMNTTTTVDVAVTSAKWSTLILPFDAEVPSDLAVYACNTSNDNILTLTQQDAIVANTPYLIYGEPDNYTFTGTASAWFDTYDGGWFTGAYVETAVPENSYILAKVNGVLGFYKVTGSNVNKTKIAPYHCYMTPTDGSAKAAFFFDDDTNGINNVEAESLEGDIFDLMGRKLDAPQKGINIINGKKIIVR